MSLGPSFMLLGDGSAGQLCRTRTPTHKSTWVTSCLPDTSRPVREAESVTMPAYYIGVL